MGKRAESHDKPELPGDEDRRSGCAGVVWAGLIGAGFWAVGWWFIS
ncbi:MAG: hypothetical protein AAFQ21_04580 [Pseudomonadota bacterium]